MRTPPVAALAALASLCACGRSPPPVAGDPPLLARVNGVAITQADLDERTRRTPAGGAPGHDASTGNVLQTVVREELIAQKAVQLGLDREPGYRASLAALEAQVSAFRRKQLGELYGLRSLGRLPDLPAELERDHAELKAGTPFVEVAARRYPDLPAGAARPWDLGEMGWMQIPAPWRGIVDRLEPGQISDVIQGENGRAWVIQLAAKRVDPAITFETERDRIVQLLRQENAARLYGSLVAELGDKATITYANDGPSPRARPE